MAKKKKARKKEADEGPGPGWAALDEALRPLHGERPAFHFAPVPPAGAGGDHPLAGISVYEVKRPRPHWLFVTYGFTELFEKETPDPEVSGYGFELTLGVVRGEERQPPTWPLELLQYLGRYVFRTGNAFASGHHMTLNGPIRPEGETALEAVAFVADPDLVPRDTPNGRVEFVRVVGITTDELQATSAWDTLKLLEVLESRTPGFVTDPDRRSLLADAKSRRRIEEGIERDGSSQEVTFVDGLRWRKEGKGARLQIGALPAGGLRTALRGRTGHGRPFVIVGPEAQVEVEPAKKAGWKVTKDGLVLRLDPALARTIADRIGPTRGEHRFEELPGLVLEVVPTEVTGPDGAVLQVVG